MARFQIEDKVNSFCERVPFENFLKMKVTAPAVDLDLAPQFPLFLIYYRENPGKKRMLRIGWNTKKLPNGKYQFSRKVKHHKKASTSDQNDYSVYVYYAKCINSLGTINRIVKHKGHGMLVDFFHPTSTEIEFRDYDIRLVHKKYKNFNQLYLRRKVYSPDFKFLTDRLEETHKCTATGQTLLF